MQVDDGRLAHLIRAYCPGARLAVSSRAASYRAIFGRDHLVEREDGGRARRARAVSVSGPVARAVLLAAAAAPARGLHREADHANHHAERRLTRSPARAEHNARDDCKHLRNHREEQRAQNVPREHRPGLGDVNIVD